MTDLADHSAGTGRRVAGLRSCGAARGGHALVEVRRRRIADCGIPLPSTAICMKSRRTLPTQLTNSSLQEGRPVSAALLLQLPSPVEHDCDRDRPVFFHEPGHEETLTVGRDTVRS